MWWIVGLIAFWIYCNVISSFVDPYVPYSNIIAYQSAKVNAIKHQIKTYKLSGGNREESIRRMVHNYEAQRNVLNIMKSW